MWQGDANYWSGRNPILFPIVGKTWDRLIHLPSGDYTMGNHGFARHSIFEVVKSSTDQLTLLLKQNAETLKQYPYQFRLYVDYQLRESTLMINYRIFNDSLEVMPFTLGLHPAFNCSQLKNEESDDCYLEFPHCESQKNIYGPLNFQGNKLPLSYQLFANNETIGFKHLVSNEVSLINGNKKVTVNFTGFPYMAFWTVLNSQFVCLEPWLSKGDLEKNKLQFSEREGMINLLPKRSYNVAYQIKIA